MRAVTLESPGHFRAITLPDPPPPGSGEALVRIHRVGVCGTDYHAFDGEQPFFAYPRILGHEVSVEVLAVGPDVNEVKIGSHGALRPYFTDGICSACRHGKPNCCLNMNVFGVHSDGGMREMAIVPASHIHSAPSLSFDQLALVEPLAIGAHAVTRAHLAVGERTLVIGTGPIGLAITQFAILAGAQVIAMDISPQRLAFCQSQWPTITGFDARGDALAMLRQVAGDDLPTAVFDATGNPSSMQAAFTYVGHGGRLIFAGFHQGDVIFHDPTFHSHEMTLLGSRNALDQDFQQIIAAMEAGRIVIAPWITHRATLETVADVFPQWHDPDSGIIKGLITL